MADSKWIMRQDKMIFSSKGSSTRKCTTNSNRKLWLAVFFIRQSSLMLSSDEFRGKSSPNPKPQRRSLRLCLSKKEEGKEKSSRQTVSPEKGKNSKAGQIFRWNGDNVWNIFPHSMGLCAPCCECVRAGVGEYRKKNTRKSLSLKEEKKRSQQSVLCCAMPLPNIR